MFKRFLICLITLFMLPVFTESAQSAEYPYEYIDRVVMTIGSKTAYVNGKPVVMKTISAPYIKSGRVIVPLRFVAENLEMSVTWDGFLKGRTDAETKDGKIVEFLAGDKRCYYGNFDNRIDTHANAGWVPHVMDVAPVVKNDKFMYVPLRNLVEGIGAFVSYDNKTKTVVITRIDTAGWKEYTELFTGTKIKYPHDWKVDAAGESLDIYNHYTEFIFTYESRTPLEVLSYNKGILLNQGWKIYRDTPTYITLTKQYYNEKLTKIISTRKLKGGCLVYKVNTSSNASPWDLKIIDFMTPGNGI